MGLSAVPVEDGDTGDRQQLNPLGDLLKFPRKSLHDPLYTGQVRRPLAISLLLIFALPLVAPLWMRSADEVNLPACCRRDGKHHCNLSSDAASQPGQNVRIIEEKCPYAPAVPAAMHLELLAPSPSASAFAELAAHPAIHAQTEAQYRVSFDRSRQKRGPPSLILL